MTGKSLHKKGFTLVELLVAMAVLSLLVLIIVQVTALTGQAISINSKNLDAAGQARLVFDQMGSDFSARINRPDVPMSSGTVGDSDSFQFYSEVEGYGATAGTAGKRQISVVGYRVNANSYQLERGSTGSDFTGTGIAFSSVPPLPALVAPADGDFDVLAPGVFRLKVCYLIKSGTKAGLISSSNQGASANDFSNVAAFVVAIGVIDSQSLKLVSSTQVGNLATALIEPTEGNDPLTAWNATINAGLAVSGVPRRVCQNVHVYERTFYVP